MAFTKLNQLRESLGKDAATLKNVTLQSLRRSAHLRSLILDYNFWHFSKTEEPKYSFQREYATEQDKEIAETQKSKQSQMTQTIKQRAEVNAHNQDLVNEYIEGEEGVDYKYLRPGETAPDVIDDKKLVREIKKEIKKLSQKEQELAEYYDKQIFSTNTEIDNAWNFEIPEDQIKFYPGSIKGPEPEDDPEGYSRWFIENQPDCLKDENGNIEDAHDLGLKFKTMRSQKDVIRAEKSKA